MAINSASKEEFQVKILEDQLKSLCCIYYMISKVIFLGHCVKMRYDYQERMEGVVCKRYIFQQLESDASSYIHLDGLTYQSQRFRDARMRLNKR
jgi:hypothetical protein